MLELKYILLLALCFSQLYNIDASLKTFEKSINVTNHELWYSDDASMLTYASCIHIASDVRRCRLIRERSLYTNETDSCDVSLSHRNKTLSDLDDVGMVALENDNVLLYIAQEKNDSYVKFATINFRDCKVRGEHEILTYLPVGKGRQAVSIAAFEDSYEVHYLKRNVNSSSNPIHARVVFDYDGKVVDGPTDVVVLPYSHLFNISALPYVFPITKSSRNKGVYLFESRYAAGFLGMTILHPDGTKRHFDVPSGSSSNRVVDVAILFYISTTQNLVTICSNLIFEKLDFKCVQYNEDGHVNFKTDFIGAPNDPLHLTDAIYNLPDGGVIASVSHVCEGCVDILKNDDVRESVVKIDAKGKTVGKILVKSFDYGSSKQKGDIAYSGSFYVNEKKEYCLRSTRFEENYPKQSLKFITNCFVEADFVTE